MEVSHTMLSTWNLISFLYIPILHLFFNDQIKKTLSTLNGLLKASDFAKTKGFLVQSTHYLLCPMESFEKQNGLKTPDCLEHRKMFLACKK